MVLFTPKFPNTTEMTPAAADFGCQTVMMVFQKGKEMFPVVETLLIHFAAQGYATFKFVNDDYDNLPFLKDVNRNLNLWTIHLQKPREEGEILPI